jgi:arylsulfatase A-like enzyme
MVAQWIVALLGACLAIGGAQANKPHILLMVLDDIGRADTGLYGDSNIPMPKLKSLATNGVILENFYTQTVCSPTRSSLMTGRYPFRFGMQHFTVSFVQAACVPRSL